ncbi:YcaO-like family protein [Peribacillus muralis]|uniref:YcaO-like family protein n=1 Tax=Peribacillus muralis TaxID=264697 RepID=UPI003D03783F
MGFIYENENTCLVMDKGNLYTIQTEDAKTTVEIANKLINGEDTSLFEEELVEEVKAFIHTNFSVDSLEENTLFYSSVKIATHPSVPFEQWIKSSNPKVFYLSNLSPNQLKQLFPFRVTNAVGVIDIDNVLFVTPFLRNDNVCLTCIVERWIESHPEIYQYKGFHDNANHSAAARSIREFAIEKAYMHLREQKDVASIIHKMNSDTIESRVLSRESCTVCFGDKLKETADFSIEERRYLQQGNGHRSNNYHESLKILGELVNPLGPVTELEEYGFGDKLNMSVFQSVMSYNPLQKSFPFHGGKGPDYYQAKLSAIGEAMERYNARHFGNERMIRDSYEHLITQNKNVLSPRTLCLDKEYPITYKDSKLIDWVEARRVSDFEKVLVPANSVFFLYIPESKELQFMPQDTTGLASGLNVEEAILQGLLEIVERDAYAIYYRHQLPATTIKVDGLKNHKLCQLITHLKSNNIDIHLKFLRTDLPVYVVHCTTEDKDGGFPIYTHGAGASLNPEVAITRAITECIQLRTSQIEIKAHEEQFIGDEEYEAYFEWGNGNKEYVGNLLVREGDSSIDIMELTDYSTGSLKTDIEKITGELIKLGHEVYVSDLSRDDNPIHTVRVIVPGLQTTDDSLRRNTERMYLLPDKLGNQPLEKMFNKPLFS